MKWEFIFIYSCNLLIVFVYILVILKLLVVYVNIFEICNICLKLFVRSFRFFILFFSKLYKLLYYILNDINVIICL